MTYGIELTDSDGDIEYSTVDVAWNPAGAFTVDPGQDVTRTFPLMLNKEVVVTQAFIDGAPMNDTTIAADITVSGADVIVEGGNRRELIQAFFR